MSIHEEKDIFRHSPLRYLGYLNEVGEAFRYEISRRKLIGSYIISTLYVLGDSIDKGYKTYNKHINNKLKKESKAEIGKSVLKTTAMVLSWQIVATEVVPAFIVFQCVKFLRRFKLGKWTPTLGGLGLILVFPYSVDPVIDYLFDLLKLDIDSEVYL